MKVGGVDVHKHLLDKMVWPGKQETVSDRLGAHGEVVVGTAVEKGEIMNTLNIVCDI